MLSPLGEGGYGAVYLAEQLTMGRQVAVKVINPKVADSQDFVDRFEREARVASCLKHPNTVVYFDFGRDGDVHYLAMEYVEGRTLRAEIGESGPMSVARAAHIAIQICGSLSEAHGVGMVHRDLKPANILLTERGGDVDFVKVIDFGLAKMVQGDTGDSGRDLTAEGVLVGTPAYMAPEQIRGRPLDNRCDVYALGVILFVMLTGQKPYDGDTPLGTAVMHLTEEIPLVRSINPGVPIALEALVSQCLAKDPDDRPPNVDAIADALDEIVAAHGGDTGRRFGRRPPSEGPARTATLEPTPSTRSGRQMGAKLAVLEADPSVETIARPRRTSTVSRPLVLGLLAATVLAVGAAVAVLSAGGETAPSGSDPPAEGAGGLAVQAPSSASGGEVSAAEGTGEGADGEVAVAPSAQPLEAEPAVDPVAVRQAIAEARIRLSIGLVETQLAVVRVGAAPEAAEPSAGSERRRRRREARAQPAATGRLRITARPWGRVTCEGRDLGRTPVDEELPVGEYECRIVSPQGVEAVRRVTVGGDDDPTVVVRFER